MSSPRHQSPRLLGCLLTHSLLQKDGGRFCSRQESGPRPVTGQPPPRCGFTGLSPGSAAPSTDICFLPRRQLHFAFSSKNAHLDPLNPRTSESHRSALTCDFLPELGVTSAPSLASGAPSATQIRRCSSSRGPQHLPFSVGAPRPHADVPGPGCADRTLPTLSTPTPLAPGAPTHPRLPAPSRRRWHLPLFPRPAPSARAT